MSSDAQRKAASRYLATKKTVTIRFDPTEAVAVSTAAAAAVAETLNEMGIPEEFLAGLDMAAEGAQADDVSEAALAAAHELFGE